MALCSVLFFVFVFSNVRGLFCFSGLFLALTSRLRTVRLQRPCTLRTGQLVASHSGGESQVKVDAVTKRRPEKRSFPMQKDQRVSAVQPLIPNARLSEAKRGARLVLRGISGFLFHV